MSAPRLRLGQLLVDARMISNEALEEVLAIQRADGRRLGTILVERGLVDETQLTQILSHQLAIPWVSLLHVDFSRRLLNLIPREIAEAYCLVPIYVRRVRGQGDTLYVAMDDPTNEDALRECVRITGMPVRAMIAPPSDVRAAVRAYYGGDDAPAPRSVAASPAPDAAARPEEEAPRQPEAGAPAGEPGVAVLSPQAGSADAGALGNGWAGGGGRRISPNDAIAAFVDRPEPRADAPPVAPRGEPPAPRTDRLGRLVSLTLLDGTTIAVPGRSRKPPEEADSGDSARLTARDVVSALRAAAHGADASDILGERARWEAIVAALLSVLLKKQLIADWELVEELKRI